VVRELVDHDPIAECTLHALRCSGSSLGTLERCQRPHSVSPGDLLLVLILLDTPLVLVGTCGTERYGQWHVCTRRSMRDAAACACDMPCPGKWTCIIH